MNRTAVPVEARKNRHDAAMRLVTGGIRGLSKPLQADIVVSYSSPVGAGGASRTLNRASIQSAAWSSCGGFGCLRGWWKEKSNRVSPKAGAYETSLSCVVRTSTRIAASILRISARVGGANFSRFVLGATSRIALTRTWTGFSPCCETSSAIRESSRSIGRTIPTCRNIAPLPRQRAKTIRPCSSFWNKPQRPTNLARCGRVA